MRKRDERQYIEEVGMVFEQSGLSRTAGRILGRLLISDPPHQDLNELADSLEASKSGVSTESRMLIRIGLIERIRIPGERRNYYRITPGIWERSLQSKMEQITAFRQLADRGLDLLKKESPERRQPLESMHSLYALFERELPTLLKRWERERAKRSRSKKR